MMRLTTWNVNGIRNPFAYPPWNSARTFSAMFEILASDIVVMQELKIQRKDLRDDMVLIDGWDCYFSLPKHKKGYSGVAIYTRNATCAPIRAEEGLLGVLQSATGAPYCELPVEESIGGYPDTSQINEIGVDPALLDSEGRCVIVEFPAFVLLGVYAPANSNGLRDDFRFGFLCALDCRIRNLIKLGKQVVLVGDLNVSRSEIDSAGAVEDRKKAGMSHEEYVSTPNRRVFNQLIIDGEVCGERDEGREEGILWDTSRKFHADRTGMYTHWETKVNARPGNFGSRIDYILVSQDMLSWLTYADIQEGLLGSDHCPVFADFAVEVHHGGQTVNLLDIMNPAGVFQNGIQKREWKVSTAPAFSGKRLPEFDKRRSIKSMFARPNLSKSESLTTTDHDTAHERELAGTSPRPALPLASWRERQDKTATNSTSGLKRSTSSTSQETKTKKMKSQTDPGKAQKSLRGFFQTAPNVDRAQQTTVDSSARENFLDNHHEDIVTSHTCASKDDMQETLVLATPNSSVRLEVDKIDTGDLSDTESIVSPSNFAIKLAEAEESQKSWGILFSRPVAPLCEGHQESCKSMLTKKKGTNQGRSFWMCARPLGPSGNKERGTEWRCSTFIWCSDWVKKADGAKDASCDTAI